MNAPNRIPQDEYDKRVKDLIPKLIPKGTADAGETKELFQLYNDRNLPRESNEHCAGCRQRVYQKMLKYYNEIKGE